MPTQLLQAAIVAQLPGPLPWWQYPTPAQRAAAIWAKLRREAC